MIKEAIFCDICNRHVHKNTSISFYIVPDMVPVVDIRNNNTKTNQNIKKGDITLCESCENDVYAIIQNRKSKKS